MLMWIKKAWEWIKVQVNKFNDWAASIAPGIKTKLVAGAGAVGSGAAALQQYITGLPLDQIVTAEKAVMISAVLFTLAFWTRHISEKDA